MPKLQFTEAELKGYFNGTLRHHFYETTKDKAADIRIHSDEEYPEELIQARRPNEPEAVQEYRKVIWIAKTKPTFNKLFSSLSKIRRASDWSIRYENQEDFARIDEKETLEEYCEKNFPNSFTSLTNWTFSVLLKKYLVDPNAVVFVNPIEEVVEENVFRRPFPFVFDSCDVLDFVHADYAVLNNPLGSIYFVKGEARVGKSYYFITTEKIVRFDQVNDKGRMVVNLDEEHGLPELPVFKIGAIIAEAEGGQFLYESRIRAMIPELDEAIREYSDLQAAKVTHVYPERWEYTQNECLTCKGTRLRTNPAWYHGCGEETPESIECDNPDCHNGYVVTGPYSKILIKPQDGLSAGANIPNPPAGIIQRDVEIVKLMDEGVDKHIYAALAAINFEFLMNTPLNQSGTAKEVDKDELNNTVHSIAEDLVRVMDWIYRFIAYFRYGVQYDFDEIKDKMVPRTTVPEKYDILSSTHLEQELASAKTNKANPIILNALEKEYASKKFNSDPGVRDLLTLQLELDPLPNVTEDEKMSRLSNGGIAKETYVISSNIQEFVQDALEEDKDFPDKPLKEKKAKMKALATALIKSMDEAKKLAMVVAMDDQGGLGREGDQNQQGQNGQGQQNGQDNQGQDQQFPNNAVA